MNGAQAGNVAFSYFPLLFVYCLMLSAVNKIQLWIDSSSYKKEVWSKVVFLMASGSFAVLENECSVLV